MPLLPFAALDGGRGVPGVASTSETAYLESPTNTEENPIPEGSHRGDFLHFFKSGANFHSVYSVGSKIGEGGFGKVFEALHQVLGISRAVKRINKSKAQSEWQKEEISALLALDHPHIVKLVEFYDEDPYLYLVFERCHGPDLLERIQRAPGGRLSELEASIALRHMLKALQCCHAQHRGHYDIKPENFMFVNEDVKDLMMIDLGMSSGFDRQRKNRIKGTVEYMAPEFWHGMYGPEGDIWSCGVVLFVMLTGHLLMPDVPPATLKRESKCRAILKERLRAAVETHNLSPGARDLLSAMLKLDRHARPTVREALKHPFNTASYETERLPAQPAETAEQSTRSESLRTWSFSSVCENQSYKEALAVRQRLADNFRAASREPTLKRLARMAMAHCVDVSVRDLAAERLVFRMLDQHGYGELSITVMEDDYEFRKSEIPEDFGILFEAMDLNRDGYIGYENFLAIMLPFSLRSNANWCKAAFAILDLGRDGYIDAQDIAECFGHRGSELCEKIIAEVCPQEPRMDLAQFVEMMTAEGLSAVAEGDVIDKLLSRVSEGDDIDN